MSWVRRPGRAPHRPESGPVGHHNLTGDLDAEHAPAYLESSNPDNRAYYNRFGFEVTGEIVMPDGPTLWPMWRAARSPDS